MISAESFWTASLRASSEGDSVTRILAAAIAAVELGEVVRRVLQRNEDTLEISGWKIELSSFHRVCLLGISKASLAMAGTLTEIIGPNLSAGLVVCKHVPSDTIDYFPFTLLQGGHPVPDEGSLLAGEKVVEFVSALGPGDLLICLISGGVKTKQATSIFAR